MLFDALVTGDCVICLQPLVEGPSARNTPQKGERSSRTDETSPGQGRRSVQSPAFLPSGAVSHALGTSSTAGGFHISYAPGVPRQYAEFGAPAPATATPASSRLTSSTSLSGPSSSSDALCGTTAEARGLSDVTLLPCGHGFFHYGCILQLYEYSRDSKCPVCRAPIRTVNDLIPFHPRTRPRQLEGLRAREFSGVGQNVRLLTASSRESAEAAGEDDRMGSAVTHTRKRPRGASVDALPARRGSVVSDDGDEDVVVAGTTHRTSGTQAQGVDDDGAIDSDSSDEEEEDDITLVGSRQVDPSDAYCGLLQRIARQYEDRASKVHERGINLRKSLKELEEDCNELQLAITDCRRRQELLGDRGDGRRLLDLRRTCVETRNAGEVVTQELAAAIRENAELQRQMDKLKRKSERLA